MQLESYKKADAIVYQIIKATNGNGMTTLLYVAWYVMSELHLRQNKYDVAFGIVNNSLIQLEKNNTTSEYIAQKYGINFEFDADPSHYIPVEEESVEEAFTESDTATIDDLP